MVEGRAARLCLLPRYTRSRVSSVHYRCRLARVCVIARFVSGKAVAKNRQRWRHGHQQSCITARPLHNRTRNMPRIAEPPKNTKAGGSVRSRESFFVCVVFKSWAFLNCWCHKVCGTTETNGCLEEWRSPDGALALLWSRFPAQQIDPRLTSICRALHVYSNLGCLSNGATEQSKRSSRYL